MNDEKIHHKVKENTLVCGDCEITDDVKNTIAEKNITHISFIGSYPNNNKNLNIFAQLNFPNNNIKKITFNDAVFYPTNKVILDLSNLPEKIEELTIQIRKQDFITCIILINHYGLPSGLKKLELDLPTNFLNLNTNLEFFNNFPFGLKFLEIKMIPNQTIDYLPNGLEILIVKFDEETAKNIFDNLPSGLEQLIIKGPYSGKLNNLPFGLKLLYLPHFYSRSIENIPENLNEIQLPITNILIRLDKTNSIKKIIIGHAMKTHARQQSVFNLSIIPQSVEELKFEDNFNQSIEFLHTLNNIKKISFGFNFNNTIISNYEIFTGLVSLETLIFGYNYNTPLFLLRFTNLKYLELGRCFSQELMYLPDSLIHLKIGERFVNFIKFPSKLEILEFDNYAQYNRELLNIPDSVHTIIFSKYYANCINIPKKLTKITYPMSNRNITIELEKQNFNGQITLL